MPENVSAVTTPLARSQYAFTRRVVTGYNYSIYCKTGDNTMEEVASIDVTTPVTSEKAKKELLTAALGHEVDTEEARNYVISLNKQHTKLLGVRTIEDLEKIADVIEEN